MKEFFCAIKPSDWINFVGLILGSLLGTGIAGCISIMVSKHDWEKRFLLDNDELRKLLIIYKNSFKKIYSCSIMLVNETSKNENIIIREIEHHSQIILDNFDPNNVPANLYRIFNKNKSIIVAIRNRAKMKRLYLNDTSIFDAEEFEKFIEIFKSNYLEIFEELKI